MDLLQFDQTFWPDWQALYAAFHTNGDFEDPEWFVYDSVDGALSFIRFNKDGRPVRRMETSEAFYKPSRPQLLGRDARKARGKPRKRQRSLEE